MNDPDDLELPEDVLKYVRAERDAPEAPAEAKLAVLDRVHATVGVVPSSGGGGGATSPAGAPVAGSAGGVGALGGAKVAVALVVGAVFGASLHFGAVRLWPSQSMVLPVPSSVVAAGPTSSATLAAASATQAPVLSSSESAASGAKPPERTPAPDVRSAASARDSDLAAERALIDSARSALVGGDAKAALAAIGRHSARFPRGRLREEREALRVQALVLAGKGDEAKKSADGFKKRYPTSVLLPAVTESLDAGVRTR